MNACYCEACSHQRAAVDDTRSAEQLVNYRDKAVRENGGSCSADERLQYRAKEVGEKGGTCPSADPYRQFVVPQAAGERYNARTMVVVVVVSLAREKVGSMSEGRCVGCVDCVGSSRCSD